MATVYRVENADHLGPFRGGFDDDEEIDFLKTLPWGHIVDRGWEEGFDSDKSHPTPLYDGFKNIHDLKPDSWEIGVASMKGLKHWFGFPATAEWLNQHGERVVTYKVPAKAITRGKHQLMFRKDSAVEVGEPVSPLTLINEEEVK